MRPRAALGLRAAQKDKLVYIYLRLYAGSPLPPPTAAAAAAENFCLILYAECSPFFLFFPHIICRHKKYTICILYTKIFTSFFLLLFFVNYMHTICKKIHFFFLLLFFVHYMHTICQNVHFFFLLLLLYLKTILYAEMYVKIHGLCKKITFI